GISRSNLMSGDRTRLPRVSLRARAKPVTALLMGHYRAECKGSFMVHPSPNREKIDLSGRTNRFSAAIIKPETPPIDPGHEEHRLAEVHKVAPGWVMSLDDVIPAFADSLDEQDVSIHGQSSERFALVSREVPEPGLRQVVRDPFPMGRPQFGA